MSGYLSVSLTGEGSGYWVYRSISLSIYLMEEEKNVLSLSIYYLMEEEISVSLSLLN